MTEKMYDSDRKAIEACLTLAKYCEDNGDDCSGCVFRGDGQDDCPIGTPSWYKIPAAIVKDYQDSV